MGIEDQSVAVQWLQLAQQVRSSPVNRGQGRWLCQLVLEVCSLQPDIWWC